MSARVRLEDMSVLIVDDEPANVELLQQILKRYDFTRVHGITDPRLVAGLVQELAVDIVVLDMHMPHLDGFQLLEQLRDEILPRGVYLPRLVVTADVNPHTRRKALSMNAHDFLLKPINAVETFLRIRNLLQTRRLYLELQEANAGLEDRVQERTAELEQSVQGAAQALVDTLALASPAAFGRALRVAPLVKAVAEELGAADAWTEMLPALSQLGAVSLPDEVLQRAATGELLSKTDLAILDRVPAISASLLPALPSLEHLRVAVRRQAERFDAETAGDLPLGSKLLRIAFDLDRAMARGLPAPAAVSNLLADAGAHDPVVVEAFAKVLREGFGRRSRMVQLSDLEPGLVLAQDVINAEGRLLVGRGTRMNDVLIERLTHFVKSQGLASSLLVEMDSAA